MILAANATVMVDDLDRAVNFYVKILGLDPGMRAGPHYAEVHAPGLTIGLHPRRPGNPTAATTSNLSIGFQVELDDAVRWLTGAGISFAFEENDANRFAFFHDPDGTALYLVQPKSASA
jgi:catechol 2,3-dioxygenase-like lactoylglutathione lyase family enzyme